MPSKQNLLLSLAPRSDRPKSISLQKLKDVNRLSFKTSMNCKSTSWNKKRNQTKIVLRKSASHAPSRLATLETVKFKNLVTIDIFPHKRSFSRVQHTQISLLPKERSQAPLFRIGRLGPARRRRCCGFRFLGPWRRGLGSRRSRLWLRRLWWWL